MAAQTIVTLREVQPVGTTVTFALIGDSVYAPASSGSTGGWQIVDRPRLVAATQWYDRSPMSLKMTLMLDSKNMYGNNTTSIEEWCMIVDQWQDKVPGTNQPVVLAITGPVPGVQHQWILQTVSFEGAIRDPIAGFRLQQTLKVTLYEYNSALATISSLPTPATAAVWALNTAEASQSFTLYTVAAGDTLQSIAASVLGSWLQWGAILNLNNIRDPASIVPGQILKIPQG